jgi:hypothetical protein
LDIVLGMSMAPTAVRMLLVEGENADGVTVEEGNFDIVFGDDSATLSASDQVISAILGTREGAADAGYLLTSTGVTWTDQVEAAALREALAARKVENVMLVSAFMAAAALAQAVGSATGTARTALLFLEPDTATLAVVDSADGSIADVRKQLVPSGDAFPELAGMVAGLDALEPCPEGVFVVGSGVDIAAIKPWLDAVTSLPVSAPEEPETALAWGAALASANAPLFVSSTAALAYAQDPGTGEIDPLAVAPGYLAVPDVPFGAELGEDDVAYSAVPDEEAEANTVVLDRLADDLNAKLQRRPVLLIGSVLAVVFVTAALALEVALALGIRPAVALRPNPGQQLIVPTEHAPAPAPAQGAVSIPQLSHPPAPAAAHPPISAPIPAPPPAAPVPGPVLARPPVPVVAPPIPLPMPLPAPVPAGPLMPAHAVPVRVPAPQPPVIHPQPPVVHPAPHPPVVHVPAQLPTPPVHAAVPEPPVHMPAPKVPTPPVQLPKPPVQAPLSGPPVHMPAPEAPLIRAMPVPQAPPAPAIPAPVMPAPEPPPAVAQLPRLPRVAAPQAQAPSFNVLGGGDHSFGGFGGVGGGDHSFGGFGGVGGGHSFGGFGGGHR